MPTYDYDCTRCGPFSALRRMAERDAPAPCPACAAPDCTRVFAAPQLLELDAGTRAAHAANERAAHEPQSSSSYTRLRHPAGCGCCKVSPGKTVRHTNGDKSFARSRPWMISH